MKRIFVLIFCMLLCFAACTKPAPAPQPTEAPAPQPTEAPAAEATDAPVEPTEVPAEPTEAPVEPTDAPAEPEKTGLTFSTITLNGAKIDSDMFKDYDLIIVNCWAEWCGPCIGELPALERIHQEYPNVLILGVLVASYSMVDARTELSNAGVTYPTLKAAGDLEEVSYRSDYIPATYFFDRNGIEIGEPIIGGQSYEEWKAVIESYLN